MSNTIQSVVAGPGVSAYAVFGPFARGRVISGVFVWTARQGVTATFAGVTVRGFSEAPPATAQGFAGGEKIAGANNNATDDEIFVPIGQQTFAPIDGQADRFSYLAVRFTEKSAGDTIFGTAGVQTARGSELAGEDRRRVLNSL